MRAVVRDEYGGPDVLKIEEIDKPELVDDGVIVRVRAAALNPTDYVLMRGFLRPQTGWRRPRQRVVGIDVAGIVEAVGADVADLAVGDAVFGVCRGAFAEYAVGVPRNLVQKPERLSFEQAAGMGVAGTMALQALRDHAQLRAGQVPGIGQGASRVNWGASREGGRGEETPVDAGKRGGKRLSPGHEPRAETSMVRRGSAVRVRQRA
jgi:NADPH:quinone reductase-like Zn-dependent oxidoreductase